MRQFVRTLTLLCFLIAVVPVFAEPLYVDYYGVVSQSSENNILKMAQDIFLTQLKSLANVTVDDMRTDPNEPLRTMPDFSSTTEPHRAFYAEIREENGDEGKIWHCTFTLLLVEQESAYSKTKQFDSYYKILVNAKSAIEQVFEAAAKPANQDETAPRITQQDTTKPSLKLETLAGTWTGEPHVDKIILLRGGKGFVIFKNGASMNVKVTVTDTDAAGNITDLVITQDAKANASFFPQLSRETALALAAGAPPIVWTLHAAANDTLTGSRKTLVPDGSTPEGASVGTESAVWTKR